MVKQKIISGNLRYVRRACRDWIHAGYSIVKTKLWSDGKYTVVLERR